MADLFSTVFGAFAGPFFLLLGLGFFYYATTLLGINIEPIVSVVVALTPLWLPTTIFYILYERWMDYVRLKFKLDNGRTTLRVKLPQEVFKSPEAMESVFAQIHNPNGSDNLWQAYLDGKHPLTFSFELVSHGGDVRFYINVPTKKTKNAVEAQLYAQYPGIEIIEEKLDYTAEISWDPKRYEMMSFHIGKKEDEIFPIKTYIEFGLDRLPKEEEKFEPMAAMLEQLGKAKPHERIWVQILATPHAKKNFKTGDINEQGTWESRAQKKINEMLGRDASTKLGPGEFESQPRLTTGERDTITAMERNIGKYAYEVAIRFMYITETGKFNGDFIGPMLRTFAQYDIIKRNGIGARWRTDFDYNWFSDWSGKKKLFLKKAELDAYKKRSYTEADKKTHNDSPKVFSVEELATIYHIPGRAIVTPGLSRIMSNRKEAPTNLPTGIPSSL
jgi:hypothetical protein